MKISEKRLRKRQKKAPVLETIDQSRGIFCVNRCTSFIVYKVVVADNPMVAGIVAGSIVVDSAAVVAGSAG